MKRSKQRGVALILTLIMLIVISVLAVSILFLAQTETWSSFNYRLMAQSRYGAEAGLNAAANYLLYSYSAPTSAADLANYVMTVSPVTYSGNPVILSGNSTVSSNYPASGTQTAFNSASQGTVTTGNTTVNYAAYATLLSMRQITVYGSASPVTIQTWQITSDGTISGAPNSQVELSAILERQVTPVFNYAVFADSAGCSALTFGGGGSTNSYDSSTVSGGTVTTQNYGGNVGTNGNLSTGGSTTTINGSLSTPRTGVGTCSVNNVTAWTDNQGTVTGGLIELPQNITYPPPAVPSPLPPTDSHTLNNGDCSGDPAGCTGNKGSYTLTPSCASTTGVCAGAPLFSYGNITLNGNAVMHLTAGTYYMNSLLESGQGTVVIDSGPVVINIAGTSVNGAVVDLTGGSVTNSTLNPENFQILYAGSNALKLKGGAQASGLMYAPNASFSFGGGGDWYGAIVGLTMTDMGGAAVHYDRRLKTESFMVGNFMLDSFTWKKF